MADQEIRNLEVKGTTIVQTPTANNHAATKKYVDDAIPHLYCHTIVAKGTSVYFTIPIIGTNETLDINNSSGLYYYLLNHYANKIMSASGYYYLDNTFSVKDLCGLLFQPGSVVFRGRDSSDWFSRERTIDFNSFTSSISVVVVYTYQIS